MKIGLFAMGTNRMAGGDLLRSVAANAERLGVATLWVPEHVVLIDEYASKYPYSGDGLLPAPTNAPILDPFLALTCWATVLAGSKKSSSRWVFRGNIGRSARANISRRCASCGATSSAATAASM